MAALAVVGFSGTAHAAPNDNACFGQIRKTINTTGVLGVTNVGDVVQAVDGQGKDRIAWGFCAA